MNKAPHQDRKLPTVSLDTLHSHLEELPEVFENYGSLHLSAIMRNLCEIKTDGNIILINFPDKFTFHKQEVEKNRATIEKIFEDWIGQPVKVYGSWENSYQNIATSQSADQIREGGPAVYKKQSGLTSDMSIFDLRNEIISCFKKGETQKAQKLIQTVRDRRGNAVKLLSCDLFYIANRIPDFQTKLVLFSESVKYDPNNEYALPNYGRVLAKNKQFEKAFEMFERALHIDSNNAVTLSLYGEALLENGRVEEACKWLKRSLEIKSDDAMTWCNYGKALAADRQYEQANQAFEYALKLRANDHRILSAYGRTLAKSGRYERACEIFNQALKIRPTDYSTFVQIWT